MFWPKVTLFGDSITRRSMDYENGCWGSMIGHKLGSFFDVDVRGFEGYNTKWSFELMAGLFRKEYLELVEIFVIFFGHNDSWNASSPAHVPVEDYERNMKSIIGYLVRNGLNKESIIVITPGWYDPSSWKNHCHSTGNPMKVKELREAEEYRDAAVRVAREESVDFVDWFAKTIEQEDFGRLFCDGLHLSTEGAKLLFNALMPIIERKLVTKYEKPLDDIWHVIPMNERPDAMERVRTYVLEG